MRFLLHLGFFNPSCDIYPINDQPFERCAYLAVAKREGSEFYVLRLTFYLTIGSPNIDGNSG